MERARYHINKEVDNITHADWEEVAAMTVVGVKLNEKEAG